MHGRVAERILSLVVSRPEAAMITGDLLEMSGPGGQRPFWFGVIQTAGCLLWRGLRTDPVGSIVHAFLDLLRLWFITLVGGAAVVTLWIGSASRLAPGASTLAFPEWGYWTLAMAAVTLLPYYIGSTTARQSRRGALVPALYLIALILSFHVLLDVLSAMQLNRIGVPFPGRQHSLPSIILQTAFILAGAIASGRRSASSPTPGH